MKKLVIGLAVALMSAMFVLPAYAIGKCEVDGPNLLPGWNGRSQVGCDEAAYKGVWIQNTIKAEGMTDDAYETLFYFVEPTADRAIAIPNASGTVALTASGGGVVATGTDGKVLIYNAATSSFEAQAVSGDITITNSGVSAIGAEKVTTAKILNGQDGSVLISNDASSGMVAWKTVTGDWTITNAGVATIGADKVNASKLFMNSVDVYVQVSASGGTATVASGSVMTGFAPIANVYTTGFANSVQISGSTAFVCTTAAPTASAMQYRVFFIEP